MLIRIARNRTVLTSKLCTSSELNYLKKPLLFALCISQSEGALEYTDTPNECPGYDTKQSDGEVPVMLGP